MPQFQQKKRRVRKEKFDSERAITEHKVKPLHSGLMELELWVAREKEKRKLVEDKEGFGRKKFMSGLVALCSGR